MSAIINASSLILEVTRKCNLHCAHCLRGDAQCVDMSKSTIDKLMPMLGKVSSVTFTGGEPSLNTGITSNGSRRHTPMCRPSSSPRTVLEKSVSSNCAAS